MNGIETPRTKSKDNGLTWCFAASLILAGIFALGINQLKADYIGRGGTWLDTGSIEDFYKASNFVSVIENRQGFKIACIEEIALLNKWINKKNILNSIKFYGNCEYSSYLKKLIYK